MHGDWSSTDVLHSWPNVDTSLTSPSSGGTAHFLLCTLCLPLMPLCFYCLLQSTAVSYALSCHTSPTYFSSPGSSPNGGTALHIASGTQEGKGLDLEVIIQVDKEDAWRTMAELTGLVWHLAARPPITGDWGHTLLLAVKHKMGSLGREVRMSPARTSRLDTVFLTHLLWHSLRIHGETDNWYVSLHVPLFSLH